MILAQQMPIHRLAQLVGEHDICDMSPAFTKDVEQQLSNARLTFDKFHVMKIINDAVDEVHRQEQKLRPELK